MKLRRNEPDPVDRPRTPAAADDVPAGAIDPDAPVAHTPPAAPAEDEIPRQPETPVHPEATAPVERQPGLTSKGRVRHTRVSALWVGIVVAAILTIFLLIFIAQNSNQVDIEFLGFSGTISLAVALLLAAVIGILVVAVPGSLRIMQLRRALRKNAHH